MARDNEPKSDHPLQLSVSQVETFRLCPRKWAWQKIDKLEAPSNASAALGQRVHDVAERYFKNGEPLNMSTREAQILMPGLAFLPAPMTPGLDVEQWFTIVIGPALFRGLKDLQMLKGWKSARPWLSDHKTTTSLQWSKTPEDLLVDIQAGVYSCDVYTKTGERELDLQWTYMRTSGAPFAAPTLARMTYDPMMRVIERVEQVALQIEQVKKNCETAKDAPFNAAGCQAFGGCPFVSKCNLSAKEELRSIMSQSKLESTLLTKLAARKAQKSAEPDPAVEVEETPAVAAPRVSESKRNALLGRIKQKSAEAAQEPVTVPVKAEWVEVPSEEEEVAINPPEKEASPTEEAVAARDEEKAAKKKRGPGKAKSVEGSATLATLLAALGSAILDDLADRIASRLKEE
jgi:hypothetical protein